MLHTEGAEADNSNLLPFLQRRGNTVHHRVNSTTRIRFGEVGRIRYRIDEFRFVHSNPLHTTVRQTSYSPDVLKRTSTQEVLSRS